jgi:hypothetical protein
MAVTAAIPPLQRIGIISRSFTLNTATSSTLTTRLGPIYFLSSTPIPQPPLVWRYVTAGLLNPVVVPKVARPHLLLTAGGKTCRGSGRNDAKADGALHPLWARKKSTSRLVSKSVGRKIMMSGRNVLCLAGSADLRWPTSFFWTFSQGLQRIAGAFSRPEAPGGITPG